MLRKILKRIPYFEALRAFLEQWGLWNYVLAGISLLIAAIFALWGWLESNLPNWGIALLFLGASAILLIAINYGFEVYRKIMAERLDHDAIADELVILSAAMMRAINDFVRERAMFKNNVGTSEDVDPERTWREAISEGKMLTRHVEERFGHKIVASVMLLSKLEVNIPFHLSHMHESNLMGLASYFGAVGHLIKSDNLSVAQKLDQHLAWQISNIVR